MYSKLVAFMLAWVGVANAMHPFVLEAVECAFRGIKKDQPSHAKETRCMG